ncbi:putative glucosylceramidase 3 [Rhynchophorus ferrugineus]|uniref:putative glucosylceramidase 3 n=1 Tax=Rhynchophorus ferrugineus TaxID=354439 RepID=UPI003FCEA41B
MLLFYAILFIIPSLIYGQYECNVRETEYGRVCVCNSTYCDIVPPLETLLSGHYQLYSTSKSSPGFSSVTGSFPTKSSSSATVTITVGNVSDTLQTIIGFGGAFTDSFGINLLSLPDDVQQELLYSYFGQNGIQYNLGRVPIGGTDFSTRPYTYSDDDLDTFELQSEDYSYKIPVIQKALGFNSNIRLFASPWSSPASTKTSNSITISGELKDEYSQWWADYHIKFLKAYEENNITFWGLTTQNEAFDGFLSVNIPNIKYTAARMVTWIKDFLGPTIRNSSYSDLKIITHDDNRAVLPYLNWFVLSDDDALNYIDGIGLHWYSDILIPPSSIEFAKSDKKDLFILGTEACNGYIRILGIHAVELGSWLRGMNYLNNILDDLSYNVTGWTDWNLALDESGGPTYIDNNVDAPIIVNSSSGEFYKQPMFYVMGHFSKFVVPDSVRVVSSASNDKVKSMVFKRPDGKIVVTISNASANDITVEIDIEGVSGVINIAGHSVNTFLYKA